ncbi:BsuBI/PstI family type II restriction endonuclease [Streptomyces aidingensis]|uniref:BsuBI/PstI restriction endonuclease C-terminus n=1 Tax=Streptomyces aidingensis TaxID=910347 RepID=A0A1I1R8B1_9ACTN|nr:BsuBI/PstI family type II restriction endonuclease [Streptomyces aidingensis]SFD27793.1 BsuBI/PstI restriction endonuclease C-terminus [Streptomyces aidingensis]
MTAEQQEKKVREAREILAALGLPPGQQNTRTALVLLAMCDLRPAQEWSAVRVNSLGITECMEWMADYYPDIPKGIKDPTRYAPNTRESVRKESVYQLVSAGVLFQNSDAPGRATNDKNNRYHPSPLALQALSSFGTAAWDDALQEFHKEWGKLREKWAAERAARRVPVVLPDGSIVSLSPGAHSELIGQVVQSFAPQFTPGGVIAYLGDTGSKWIIDESAYLAQLGVTTDAHGKMPDVVIHYRERDWLVLIEAVTSTGPVDGQRRAELSRIFAGARPGLVFVTAFQNKEKFRQFAARIAWETEVWVAEDSTHMVHFNGERFLGPYGDR